MISNSAIGLDTIPLKLRPSKSSTAKWRKQVGQGVSCREAEQMRNSTVSGLRDEINRVGCRHAFDRRNILISSIGVLAGLMWNITEGGIALAAEFADMPALRGKDYGKSKMRHPDYTETESGLQYKDLRVGSGPTPKMGDTMVIDWDGYTIGYYGRIFEARNKTKGGSFEGDDKVYFKFRIGSQEVIPAFEEAILGITPGGVRRIIVPPELGYADNDYNKKGPRPTTFSLNHLTTFMSLAKTGCRILAGWCGEIRDVIFSENGSVTVVFRVTIRGSDGEAHRESAGTVSSGEPA